LDCISIFTRPDLQNCNGDGNVISGVGMARPIHVCGPSAPLLSILSFFVATAYDWSFSSLFNTRRTVATDPAPAFGCQVRASHIGQTNSLSALASLLFFLRTSFRAFSVYLCILTGFFSLPFRTPSLQGCLMKRIVNF
jgi:hypothetical protein